MSVEDDFTRAYRDGALVFFAGAGASYDSGAAMPPAVLEASAKLFLPRGLGRERDVVLKRAGVVGAGTRGIQPEVFYEHLLEIARTRDVLGLWRILSPAWLHAKGAALRPNANHFALTRYAARWGTPVFTTNFDMLFEDAATTLSLDVETRLPDARLAVAAPPGLVQIVKLHGSIQVDGRERLDTLQTTMQGISKINRPMIEAIRAAAQGRALAFVGYSGCDIDFFPVLAGLSWENPPFWFVPAGDELTLKNAERIGAHVIRTLPSRLFAALRPGDPTTVPGPPNKLLLETLRGEIRVAFARPRKLVQLGLCLQSMGRNTYAEPILQAALADPDASPRDRAVAGLALARVQDGLSLYERSLATSLGVLPQIRAARAEHDIAGAEARAFTARALYHAEMARQQAIGPSLAYGSRVVDWRPPGRVLVTAGLRGVWTLLRVVRLTLGSRGSSTGVTQLRAQHAVNDHAMMLLGRIISLLEARNLLLRPVVPGLFAICVKLLRNRAARTGDYFVQSGCEKYLRRLYRQEDNSTAHELFALLRDPLNSGIVDRDEAVRRLKAGEVKRAAVLFRRMSNAAIRCGSRANAIKALAGLAVCRALRPDDFDRLRALASEIEGEGYRRFHAERLQFLLDSPEGTPP